MIIEKGAMQYHVGDIAAETLTYRLYLCSLTGIGRTHLLQIATEVAHNGGLDRAAFLLDILAHHAEKLEEEYALVKKKPEYMLNYQLGFPEVVDSFVSSDQGGRRINILKFRAVEDASLMVPLSNIVRDRRRVDIRTSAWIMGKLLKILTFTYDANIANGDVTLGNVLIEPDQHYVVPFNWAGAERYPDGVPEATIRDEIRSAAQCVLKVLGSEDGSDVPNDGSEQQARYIEHVTLLARNGERDAATAHREFYILVHELLPRGFYPFTLLPR
jgi:hypothetical protein